MARIRNFDSFGAVVPHFYPDKREIWHGEALPRAKVHVYQGNVLPLWGEKPIFGPLSKNNTNMAALCAGLPVIIISRGRSNLKKSASRGPIPRLGVTPGVESCTIEFLG